MTAKFNLALLFVGASLSSGVVPNVARSDFWRRPAVTASILSDDYTTHRRVHGDSSRVGQRDSITIRTRTV